MIVGEKIKTERINRGLSQEELGNILGVTKVSICGYEKGTRTPTLDTFKKIMEFLNLTPDELLGRNINVLCEKEDYHMIITSQELSLINILRKNPDLNKKIADEIEKYEK